MQSDELTLETLGFVHSSWENDKSARREQRPARRYYELTASGAEALDAALEHFEGLARLVRRPKHA